MKKLITLLLATLSTLAFGAATPPIRYSIYTTGTVAQVDAHVASTASIPAGVITNNQPQAVKLTGQFVGNATYATNAGTAAVADYADYSGESQMALEANIANGLQNPSSVTALSVTAASNIVAASGFSFIGDGSGLTNLNGAKLQSGTVSSNTLDAATAAQLALAGTGGGSAPAATYSNVIVSRQLVVTNALAPGGESQAVEIGYGYGYKQMADGVVVAAIYNDGAGEFAAGVLSGAGFFGSGAYLTNLNASALASGTVNNARLSGVALLDGTNVFTGTNTFSNIAGTIACAGTITTSSTLASSGGNVRGAEFQPYSASANTIISLRDNTKLIAFRNTGSNVVTITGSGDIAAQGSITVSNGSIVTSNSWVNVPTLANGQNFYCSSNGVPHVIWSDEAGTLHTNRLVP